jgi:CIC family chloride channel protein
VPRLQTYTLANASSLLWYALLGLLAAFVSVAFTDSLLWLRKWFRSLSSVPPWLRPAIGGAATGSMAVVALLFFHLNGIAGDSYKTLTQALLGNLPVAAMAALCVLKLAATVTSYSSGGSGGIFAPALFMGGMLGGAVGYLDVSVFHHPADSIGAFAVVGMGAVFAGIVRAPMTSILNIFEMTSGYGLVLPMMIANISAFALARHWRHTPVYEALLEQDGIYLDRRQKMHGSGGAATLPEDQLNAETAETPLQEAP